MWFASPAILFLHHWFEMGVRTRNQAVVRGYRGEAQPHNIQSSHWKSMCSTSEIRHELYVYSVVCIRSCTAASENISIKCWLPFGFMLTFLYCNSSQQRTKKYCATSEVHNGPFLNFQARRQLQGKHLPSNSKFQPNKACDEFTICWLITLNLKTRWS